MQTENLYFINGIQQVGIGVLDVYEAWAWYHKHFGFDLPIFDDEAVANLMLKYTDGEARKRHAALVLNYQGGGGLEIWQHKSFESRPPKDKIQPGDLGIFSIKIKVKDLKESYRILNQKSIKVKTKPDQNKVDLNSFFISDPYDNLIQIVESTSWNTDVNLHSGGVSGCVIGVSNMEKSLKFYKEILGYDVVVSDNIGNFDDFNQIANNRNQYHRVILRHSAVRSGAFSNLLGNTDIELVQVLDGVPQKIFKDRMWGELGYIHLCFDVNGMDHLKIYCEDAGHTFTVDSADSFDMGQAAGRFAYIEDPDGTLIEFVETHKIPILKKIGWYYDLKKRQVQKPVSKWLLRGMALSRVKSIRK